MADRNGIYLGFDPGGHGKFGTALLDGNRVTAHTVNNVDDAMNWAVRTCGSRQPVAAGIDTLLHWATATSGLRPCDLQLRAKYQPVRNSIMAPNSLYGAMAIGGVALALRLREVWPELVLNETHPKVLLHALGAQRYNSKTVDVAVRWLVNRAHGADWKIEGEHEFDAALSSWATQTGLAEGWADIIGDHSDLLFPAGQVGYLWPEAIE
jgi:hypothetical protein